MPQGNHLSNDRAQGSPTPSGLHWRDLWTAVRVTLIVVGAVGLWRMGGKNRIAVIVAGLAAVVLLGGAVMFIVYSVRKEQRQKGIGNGQTAPPIG